jgi:hypothetical protein
MSFSLSRIKSLAAMLETTFSTSPISTFGTSGVFRVPGEEMSIAVDQEFIARAAQNDTLSLQSGVIGGKGGKITFKTPLVGLSTAAASDVAAAPYPWQTKLMQAAGLTEVLGSGGTTAASSHTTTSIVLASGDGANFQAGMLCGIYNGAVLEVRYITAISTDTLTVTPALSAAPAGAGGAVVYGAAHYIPADQADSDPGTITFVAKMDGYEYTCTGCKSPAPKLSATRGGRPMLEWAFEVDSWTLTTTSGTLPALPASVDLVALSAPFHWGTGATSTPTPEFSFDPGATLSPKLSTEGTNGRSGFVVTDYKPVLAAKPYLASAFRTDFAAKTARTAMWQCGTTHAGAFVFAAENAQINKFPGETDVGGNVGHALAMQCNAPTVTQRSWLFGVL